ncbi:MAG: metal-sensitive transcriptional regulator [Candidatus Sungbacteria bacterium]|uniref:Metal-sensitive transcriptional regulator n=1 Tax=Candidatus Sungiibacteriota bacterium TaxID=2750080 RepID=A0A931YDR7_9BACT|nr:metal-sensitive transcriptional regulator [Candidatus Sungbacteria bacterium]MBI2465999.1 metal-sensitive transcriptional regulator [Candidatus Sungbacteria bacterium]
MTSPVKKQAINRLRRVAGQIRGLEKMVGGNKYCVDILYQSLAVKQALSSFEDFILKNHLTTHVVQQIKSGKKSKAIKEIFSVYQLAKCK